MTWLHAGRTAKHNAPGKVGWRTPQFTVHEVCATAEEKANGNTDNCQVNKGKIRHVHHARRHDTSHKRTDKAAMEAHPPARKLENSQRIRGVHIPVVEKDVAQTTAHDNADHGA